MILGCGRLRNWVMDADFPLFAPQATAVWC
jgi:hypothetical protein